MGSVGKRPEAGGLVHGPDGCHVEGEATEPTDLTIGLLKSIRDEVLGAQFTAVASRKRGKARGKAHPFGGDWTETKLAILGLHGRRRSARQGRHRRGLAGGRDDGGPSGAGQDAPR